MPRSPGVSFVTSRPPSRTCPPAMGRRPATASSKEVFPQPVGPISTAYLPDGIANETPLSRKAPCSIDRFSIWIKASSSSRSAAKTERPHQHQDDHRDNHHEQRNRDRGLEPANTQLEEYCG